jgi:hypothetical protein
MTKRSIINGLLPAEYHRIYYARNKKSVRLNQKHYYERTKYRKKEQKREYYRLNKKRIIAQRKKLKIKD